MDEEEPTPEYTLQQLISEVPEQLQCVIDDYTFYLLWKSICDNGRNYVDNTRFPGVNFRGFLEERYKITFISRNNLTGVLNIYNCYTSVSELGLWRLCFTKEERPQALNKFNNYIQATTIDIRLQQFFYEHYQDLQYVPWHYVSSEFYFNRYRLIRHASPVNTNGAIPCKQATAYENRLINAGRSKLLEHPTTRDEMSEKLRNEYDILNYHPIFAYDVDFHVAEETNNIKGKIEIYNIVTRNKINGKILYFNVIYFNIICGPESSSTNHVGASIINIVDNETKIMQFGLPDFYYSEKSTNDSQKYVTKPLNYRRGARSWNLPIIDFNNSLYILSTDLTTPFFPLAEFIKRKTDRKQLLQTLKQPFQSFNRTVLRFSGSEKAGAEVGGKKKTRKLKRQKKIRKNKKSRKLM